MYEKKWSDETWWVLFYLQLLSETERTPLDSLKDRHIHHPKQKVYEINVLNLTDKVEGYVSIRAVLWAIAYEGLGGKKLVWVFFFCLLRLKERMHDLDKPLKIVNKTLWEELSGYTENEVCKTLLFLFLPNLRGPWKCDEFTSTYLLTAQIFRC